MGDRPERLVRFPDIVINNNTGWKVLPNLYPQSFIDNGEFNISARMSMRINSLNGSESITFKMVRRSNDSFNRVEQVLAEHEISRENPEPDDPEEFELTAEGVACFDTTRIEVIMCCDDDEMEFQYLEGTQLDFFCTRVYPEKDREYEINTMVNQEMNAIEIFKDSIAFWRWLLTTDFGRRKVIANQPYEFKMSHPNLDGSEGVIRGYYDESKSTNIEDRIVPLSKEIMHPSKSGKRYVRVRFQDSRDWHLEEREKEEPVHSRVHDRGDYYDDIEEEDITMPLTVPTESGFVAAWVDNNEIQINVPFNYNNPPLSISYSFQKSLPLFLPQLYGDDEDGENGYDLGVRRMLSYGVCRHGFDLGLNFNGIESSNSNRVVLRDRDNGASHFVATAGQKMNYISRSLEATGSTRLFLEDFSFNNVLADLSMQTFSLFGHMHKRPLLEDYDEIQVEAILNYTDAEINNLRINELYMMKVKGKPVEFKIKEVVEHEYDSGLATQIRYTKTAGDFVDLVPVTSNQDLEPADPVGGGPTVPVVASQCNNRPIINYSIVDGCIMLSIGGQSDQAITNVNYVVNEFGSLSLIQLENTSVATAEYCDATGPINVVAVVFYDDDVNGIACPNIVAPRVTITPCLNSDPELIITSEGQSDGTLSVRAVLGGHLLSGHTIQSFTYTPFGLGPINYTEGEIIDNVNGNIDFLATIIYPDGCGEIQVKGFFEFVEKGRFKSNISSNLEFVHDFDCVRFQRTGEVPYLEVDDYIIYREGLDKPFKRWDEESNICYDYVEARRVLIYLNSSKDNYISDPIIHNAQ